MASVLLPTIRWIPTMDAITTELREGDELIVVCDSADDPVVTDAPTQVEVIVAGDPDGCSGKAHALATGMEHATNDIIVWTDDDVERDDAGWLDRLVQRARENRVATEAPVFIGGGFWPLLEPMFVLAVTNDILSGSHVWGGGVAFDRTTIDEEQFLYDLRRTVGDDTLLSTYFDDPWVDRNHVRPVHVSGTPRNIYNRIVRWNKAGFVYNPISYLGVTIVLFAFVLGSVAFPLAGMAISTLIGILVYAVAGVRRVSVLLSFPSFVLLPFLLALGVIAPSFRWGNREYEWNRKFDVKVRSQ